MRLTFAMLLVLIISAGVFAQSTETRTYKFEKKEGSHTARVVFRTKVFARAGHRSTKVVRGQTMVDDMVKFFWTRPSRCCLQI